MKTPYENKSSIHEIRKRFDQDVERFSQLETGQAATIDAPLAMDPTSKEWAEGITGKQYLITSIKKTAPGL